MDFSALLLILLAATMGALWIVGVAAVSSNSNRFRAPFILSYALGVIFVQPWLVASWQQAGMATIMLLMMAIWSAAGCILGAIPAMIIVATVKRLSHRRIN